MLRETWRDRAGSDGEIFGSAHGEEAGCQCEKEEKQRGLHRRVVFIVGRADNELRRGYMKTRN